MKYKPEIVNKVLAYLRAGNNQKDSASLADLSEDTFYQWMKKPEFAESVKKAEAECKARMIQVVRKAAFGDGSKPPIWTAAAWWLERKFQDEFAMKYKLEHGGKGLGGAIPLVVEVRSKLKGMTKDQLKKLAEEG